MKGDVTLVLRDGKRRPCMELAPPKRLLIRNDLESVDHIPVAALGIVSELSDRVPDSSSARYAL